MIDFSKSQRGSAKMGWLIAAAVLVITVLIIGGTAVGRYNSLVTSQEKIEAAWSEIDNQYKRRFDLIPTLVNTVKGAADFEKSTLEAVTEARASVGRAQLPAGLPTDPAQLQAYAQAQQGLGAALGRLMVVVERYPELKANQNFLTLQDQLEGTENRIAVARRDYIDAVLIYNTTRRRFPASIIAGMFGFEKQPQLELKPEVRETPKVKFNFENKKDNFSFAVIGINFIYNGLLGRTF
jgi:LemA protein